MSKGEKSSTPSHQGPGERQNPVARRARAFLGRKYTVFLSGDRLVGHTGPQKDAQALPQKAQIRGEFSCQLFQEETQLFGVISAGSPKRPLDKTPPAIYTYFLSKKEPDFP